MNGGQYTYRSRNTLRFPQACTEPPQKRIPLFLRGLSDCAFPAGVYVYFLRYGDGSGGKSTPAGKATTEDPAESVLCFRGSIDEGRLKPPFAGNVDIPLAEAPAESDFP